MQAAQKHAFTPNAQRRVRRILFVVLGMVCVALGVIGMFLPLLPTTPLLLAAAWCFVRGSPRFYHWLISNRWCGTYVRNYREGRGMTLRHKTVVLLLLWLTIGNTFCFAVSALWLRLLLLVIAAAVTAHVALLKTCPTPIIAPRPAVAQTRERM